MVWICHLDLISWRYLVFCTSVVASATPTDVRMLNTLWLGFYNMHGICRK